MSKIVKRFIAGAVCPKCGEMDRLQVYTVEYDEFRECVACGFKDRMNFKPQQREIETRVNQTEEQKKTDVQVLNFPPSSK